MFTPTMADLQHPLFAAGTLGAEERLSVRTIHEQLSTEQRDDEQDRGATTKRRRNESKDRPRAQFQYGKRA
jgi:hypothetical protein